MAGDWIKFELATSHKPEVLAMADMLGIDPDEVVGKLLRVWGWFDQQSRDGNAGGVTGESLLKFIDRYIGRQGFAACMRNVGWLNVDGVPKFDRHNGESAKNRALTNRRQKNYRNAHVTPDALPEKRREEVIHIAKPAKAKGQETPIPANFALSDRVLKWAAQRGLSGTIELHLEAFVSTCKAKGYTYVDWDEAFMNAVRKNWARIDATRVDGSGKRRLAI